MPRFVSTAPSIGPGRLEPDLRPDGVEKFWASLPPDQVVGVGLDARACPLARYAREARHIPFALVGSNGWYESEGDTGSYHPHQVWARCLTVVFDIQYGSGSIKAEQALRALRLVLADPHARDYPTDRRTPQ